MTTSFINQVNEEITNIDWIIDSYKILPKENMWQLSCFTFRLN